MPKNRHYIREQHGPREDIALDQRHCMLGGGYVLCPMLEDDPERKEDQKCPWRCRFFNESGLHWSEVAVSGTMGYRTPIMVPSRIKRCLEENPNVILTVTKTRHQKLHPPGDPPQTTEAYREGRTDDPYDLCEHEDPDVVIQEGSPPQPSEDYRDGKTDDPLGEVEGEAEGDWEKK